MKLAIFGATGRTGRPLVEQALAAGHEVKALARTPAKLPIHHPRLTVIQGDATDRQAVKRTLEGCEAVISVLGHAPGAPKDVMSQAMAHMIDEMKEQRIRRLVTLTGAGVPQPGDSPKLVHRLMERLVKLTAGEIHTDSVRQTALARQSGLDWTVVRAPVLRNGPRTGIYRVGRVGQNMGFKINRADLADFLLREAETPRHLHQAPVVSH